MTLPVIPLLYHWIIWLVPMRKVSPPLDEISEMPRCRRLDGLHSVKLRRAVPASLEGRAVFGELSNTLECCQMPSPCFRRQGLRLEATRPKHKYQLQRPGALFDIAIPLSGRM